MNRLIKYIIESRFNFNIDQLDLEDNEGEFTLSKQQYKPKSMKQEYEENLFVDLGLPSGTLWCKYNYGVDPAKLSKAKNWYGKYLMWGERVEKEPSRRGYYDWTKYKFLSNSTKFDFVKYSTYDKINQLDLSDDIINIKTNGKQKIPSYDHYEELVYSCSFKWVSKYNNVRGLNGMLFTSSINGNELFFPAGGIEQNNKDYEYDKKAVVWTNQCQPFAKYQYGCDVVFDEVNGVKWDKIFRCVSIPIRGILENKNWK